MGMNPETCNIILVHSAKIVLQLLIFHMYKALGSVFFSTESQLVNLCLTNCLELLKMSYLQSFDAFDII